MASHGTNNSLDLAHDGIGISITSGSSDIFSNGVVGTGPSEPSTSTNEVGRAPDPSESPKPLANELVDGAPDPGESPKPLANQLADGDATLPDAALHIPPQPQLRPMTPLDQIIEQLSLSSPAIPTASLEDDWLAVLAECWVPPPARTPPYRIGNARRLLTGMIAELRTPSLAMSDAIQSWALLASPRMKQLLDARVVQDAHHALWALIEISERMAQDALTAIDMFWLLNKVWNLRAQFLSVRPVAHSLSLHPLETLPDHLLEEDTKTLKQALQNIKEIIHIDPYPLTHSV